MTAISINSLSKAYKSSDTLALSNITLDIPKGKITCIAGSDGSGKTTLLRVMAGLLKVDRDSCAVYEGINKYPSLPPYEYVSYLSQGLGVYEDLTVEQNLNLFVRLAGVVNESQIVCQSLELAGLQCFQNRLVKDLSGGMKQKLGIAIALLRDPKILLLDEPMTGLDPFFQNQMKETVVALKNQGLTVVFSTSVLSESYLCDHVVVLNRGVVLFEGAQEEFLDAVQNRTFYLDGVKENRKQLCEQLLDYDCILDATVEGDRINLIANKKIQKADLIHLENFFLGSRAPNFEDAYIYRIGGTYKRPKLRFIKKKSDVVENKVAIESIHLTKKFNNFTAVRDLSFKVFSGEIFGVLGPNGSGKSTLFKMLCGLLQPTMGNAIINGISMGSLPISAKKTIGYMAQKFSLYENMTVANNLMFFIRIYGVGDQKYVFEEMVEIFGLREFLNTLARDLPLGFKQRLALSCSLVHKPKVLFLDEPTSGIDSITRREFWQHISFLSEQGVTVFVSTHLMDEAELCDRIGMISNGSIRIIDRPKGIKDRFAIECPDKEVSLVNAFIHFCSSKGGFSDE